MSTQIDTIQHTTLATRHVFLESTVSIIGHNFLPCMAVFSQQMDSDLIARYRQHHWLILTGNLDGTNITSTYAFVKDVLGFDLSEFYNKHSAVIAKKVKSILDSLLSTK